MDAAGRRLSKARLPEGVAGIARLHAMIGDQLGDDVDQSEVAIGIGTDRGPWVAALVTTGCNSIQGEFLAGGTLWGRSGVSRTKSDATGAHVLANMVRTDS